jgi:hypothetical protein
MKKDSEKKESAPLFSFCPLDGYCGKESLVRLRWNSGDGIFAVQEDRFLE